MSPRRVRAAKTMMSTPVFRFAPSPNGLLHLGHALSALVNFDMARAAHGRLLLRIEDIDTTRCRPEFEAAILDDLTWLGVHWDGDVRRQSEHGDDYQRVIDRFKAEDLLYPSFETRSDIARLTEQGPWPRDPDGTPLAPGRGRPWPLPVTSPGPGRAGAWRLDMEQAIARTGVLMFSETGAGPNGETGMIVAKPQVWGDVVLSRKHFPASYHIAVVLDDALQGVTHVVRGCDLFWATSIHRLLQALLGLGVPTYHHHRLLLDAAGRKLSKSTRATALRELRAQGVTPDDIRRLIEQA
jgi:glutamyl-Q tRNA(Asp) synthetase